MAASLEGLRDRWERMNPREQALMAGLGITFIIIIVSALVAKVQDGMDSIEKKNAMSREALNSLAVYRNAKANAADTGTQIDIPAKPVALDSYLEGIISELDLESPSYPAPKRKEKGEYTELYFEVSLKGLTIVELKDFLQKIEMGSKLVVVKELTVDRNFKDKEKLDLDVTVATYMKEAAEEESEDDKGEEG